MMAHQQDEVALRAGTAEDWPCVFGNFLHSYRDSVRDVSSVIYWRGQHEVVSRLLRTASLTVAYCPEVPTEVLGWVLHEKRGPVTVLHYVYVKHAVRRMGIATRLLASIGTERCHYTHRTARGMRFAKRLGAHFNPYLAVGASP